MSASPTLEEVESALAKRNNGRSPGMDGLDAEIFKLDGPTFLQRFTNLLVKVWREELVPQERKNALMTVLYRGKGAEDDCSISRVIALHCTAGKILCRIILDRLHYYVRNEVLPE